jgi:hypothetical protein
MFRSGAVSKVTEYHDAEPETPAVQPKDAAAAGQQPVVQPQLPDMNSVTAQDRQKNTLPVPEGIAKE